MSPVRAVHGGAFFDAVGTDFQTLERSGEVVNADVLDAWYDPAPGVLEALRAHLAWLVKTSPPTHGEGLVQAIADARGLDPSSVLLGAGTSSLMYLAFPRLVAPGDRVCVLDPMYGEYSHIFEHVLGVETVRCELDPDDGFRPRLEALLRAAKGCRLVVLVNPNSPTGVHVDRALVEGLLSGLPSETRVWIDETYIDFAPGTPSAEPLVGTDPRLTVAKSLSKFYALSGLRAGYLATSPQFVADLAPMSPPWSVGLLAQVAAVEALRDPGYYAARAEETAVLRGSMAEALAALPGVTRVFDSVANFLLFELVRPLAASVCAATATTGVFLRDCDSLSPRFQGRYVRTAVKGEAENARIVAALAAALAG